MSYLPERDREKKNIRRAERRLNGICRDCNEKAYISGLCIKHHEIYLRDNRKAGIKRRANRKANGKCMTCGIDLSLCDRVGYAECVSCVDASVLRTRLIRQGF